MFLQRERQQMVYTCVLGSIVLMLSGCNRPSWQGTLGDTLSEFGHRNWIVIADSAYPKQSAPGLQTVATGKTQLEVLDLVLNAIETAPHVRAVVMLDKELESVPEADAPGVAAYRTQLQRRLRGRDITVMPHEDIIDELDQAAQTFNVLVLKSDMTIPYTSVFLQLDCGYWDTVKENRLRDTLARGGDPGE